VSGKLLTIFLDGMNFRGRHGVLASERRNGGHFRVDLNARVEAPAKCRDRLADTVDYRMLFSRTRIIVEKRRFCTLEALATAIADAAAGIKKVRSVRVRVTKMAPVLGSGTMCAVEVERP
jgi:dihydroneopterin aldolase